MASTILLAVIIKIKPRTTDLNKQDLVELGNSILAYVL